MHLRTYMHLTHVVQQHRKEQTELCDAHKSHSPGDVTIIPGRCRQVSSVLAGVGRCHQRFWQMSASGQVHVVLLETPKLTLVYPVTARSNVPTHVICAFLLPETVHLGALGTAGKFARCCRLDETIALAAWRKKFVKKAMTTKARYKPVEVKAHASCFDIESFPVLHLLLLSRCTSIS